MIHIDMVDISKCLSKEVICFFWSNTFLQTLSVYTYSETEYFSPSAVSRVYANLKSSNRPSANFLYSLKPLSESSEKNPVQRMMEENAGYVIPD